MKIFETVSPEYEAQLKRLAELLVHPAMRPVGQTAIHSALGPLDTFGGRGDEVAEVFSE